MVALGIADDEPDILRLFSLILGRSSFPIAFMARDGEEAVDRQRKTPADMVFLDYCMPYMDGLGASKKIVDEFPDTKVVLMTCGEDLADVVKGMGNVTVIRKPYAFQAIIEMLNDSRASTEI